MSILVKLLTFTILFAVNTTIAQDFTNFSVNSRSLNALNARTTGSSFSAPIYAEIENILQDDYQEIGNTLASDSLVNFDIGGGVKNYKDLTWSKPFANFSITVNRSVTPDIYSSSWIARDTLTINIKASTLLSNFSNQEIIQIQEDTLAAFAGIEFTRSFESATLVNSYKEGLYLKFDKLFFAFKKFNATDTLNINNGESLKKTDTLRFNAGGAVSVPVFTGLSVSAAALAQYSMINYVSTVSENDVLTISSQKEKSLKVGVAASLELDFFNLLKISLLSYELNYKLTKSTKVSIKLDPLRREEVLSSTDELAQVQTVLNGDEVESLVARDVSSIEERQSEELSSKYELFLFGKETTKDTESYSVQKPNETKEFYRHTNTSKSYQQTILSKFLQSLFGVTSVKTERTKTLSLEYEKDFEGNDDVKSTESFSFEISHKFYAKSLKRKKNRKRAKYFLKYWSEFDTNISDAIDNRIIKAPIQILSNFSFSKSGMDAFFNKSYNTVKSNIISFCNSKSKKARCKRRLNQRYQDLYNHNQKSTTINMDLFRDFISMIYNYSYKIEDFTLFFPKETISVNGSINAFTNTGETFNNYFIYGQVKSTGVISEFSNR